MEEYSSESLSPALFSEGNIRYLQSKIQSQIENFEKDVSKTTYIQTFNLCDIVKDRILNYEDEPQLSKTQNNFRRVYIASELVVGICSIHDHIVDFAFTKIINDLLYLDKYQIISRKITHKACSNLKKEKYFAREAHTKLLKSLKDNENYNLEEGEETKRKDPNLEEKKETEMELANVCSEVHRTSNIEKDISLDKFGQTLVEDSFRDDHGFNLVRDITEVRIEPSAEASILNLQTVNIPKDISLQPTEISIREPLAQQPVEEDINQILQSGDKIIETDITKSHLFENLFEPEGNINDVEVPQVEKLPSPTRGINYEIHTAQDSEEWSLSSIEPAANPRKKCLKLIADKLTVIPNYSERAMLLNKNIEIRRVQVFEGPPRILQSVSSEYLMKTSAFKRFLKQNVRSSMLSTLYERNLTTEKRTIEPFIMPKVQKRTVPSKITETDLQVPEKVQIQQEEIGEKIAMRSAPETSGVLAELISEIRHPEVSVNGVLERDGLMGMPVSRRTSPKIQPPDQEKINSALSIPSPRIQQLQGTTLDPKKNSPPWFFSTKETPPRAEFRKFNYVRDKLHSYWSLFEMQGMEKSISVREFLLFEEDDNFANYLTVLRIVDKLSIQRKLFLEYKNGDILIKPFENPYVSKDQLLLQEKEQIF